MASAARSVQLLLLFLLVSTCFHPTLSQETNSSSVAVHSPLPRFSFSFNFTNASSYDQSTDILLEGDAKVNGKLIDLTCNDVGQSSQNCKGRMSYDRHPVPLYDDTTLASFSTSFTFKILSNGNSSMQGDGIAFFLTGFPSTMPSRIVGGNLGLMNGTPPIGPQQFVAVEFDTYWNRENEDPTPNHIGIDINSVRSLNTTSLPLGLILSGTMTATIKFDNITHILVASLIEINGSHPPQPIVVTYQLPDLRMLLPREVAVGFSASTGIAAERHQILEWSFNSTLAPAIPRKGHDNKTTMIMTITIIGGLVLLVVVVWLILSCLKWTNRHRGIEKQGKHGPTRFEYQDLAAATDNFSEENKLGQGFFGVVYKGYLKKLGCDVAVKKILNTSTGPNDKSDFFAELNAITSVKHKNLVKLVGWCRGSSCNFVEFMCWCCKNHNNNKLFLVYELVPKGNLHDHLHKEEALPWEIRYKIVKDITSALLYLHHQCVPFILHRDIKPSNILLDDSFNAKLADFGLSRIVEDNSSKVLTIPVGTEAYLDPQCRKPVGKVEFSRSSDVYSFGIALLEIASGMPGSMLLREQVWQLYTRRCLLQAADAKLGEFNIREMESVLVLGLWCSYPDNNKRPSMEEVMAVLEHGKALPDDLNSLDTTTSVSATELETYIDPQAPTSAASSSYEQMQE